MIKLSIMSILLLTSCFQYQSESSNYTVRRDYMRKFERTASEYYYDQGGYKYYPRYNPEADNPYRDFDQERYQPHYPRYNPEDDNPYYPPSTYAPPRRDDPRKYLGHPNQYIYPKYNQEADNPYYPPVPDKRTFDTPMFDAPLFED